MMYRGYIKTLSHFIRDLSTKTLVSTVGPGPILYGYPKITNLETSLLRGQTTRLCLALAKSSYNSPSLVRMYQFPPKQTQTDIRIIYLLGLIDINKRTNF